MSRKNISESEAIDIIDEREEQESWERGAWDRADTAGKSMLNYEACEEYEKRIYSSPDENSGNNNRCSETPADLMAENS